MNKIIFTTALLILYSLSFSQNLDLIVTYKGDSIACKIDSINSSTINIQIKTVRDEKWVQTIFGREEIKDYCYDCLDPSKFNFKNDSSLIKAPVNSIYSKKFPDKSRLEEATMDELNYYLKHAKNQRTVGAILSIAGCVTIVSIREGADNMSLEAAGAILLLGTVATLIGIPVMIVSNSRVNKIKNQLSDRVYIELAPYNFQNYMAQNKEYGITFRIKF